MDRGAALAEHPDATEAELAGARVELVARYLLDAGKVVPSLTVDATGAARSWWLPLPGAGSGCPSWLPWPTHPDDDRRDHLNPA